MGSSLVERFWSKVDKSGAALSDRPELGHCWSWTGAKSHGQGFIFHEKSQKRAHRISWEMHFGSIRDGFSVFHICNNSLCVRPDHLEARAKYSPPDDRFWSKVDKIGPTPDHAPELGRCWIWVGAKQTNGYGTIANPDGKPRNFLAHRLSWQIHFGKIGRGKLICHKCDNPLCVRPEHLFIGTAKDNAEDCVAKGRHRHGEGNGTSKLTVNEVTSIRDQYLAGTSSKELASVFGVDCKTITNIVTGRVWRHVPGSDPRATIGRKGGGPGEKNPSAKLSAIQVQEIRDRYARAGRYVRGGANTQSALAKEFGVSQSLVQVIVTGKNWKAA